MSETSFRKTWKALHSFIVTARKMTGCGVPFYTRLVDNMHTTMALIFEQHLALNKCFIIIIIITLGCVVA